MIGAILADLEAWTWEHDKECFYRQLVSDEAKLSGYGLLPLSMWPMIQEGGLIHKHRLYMICGKALAHSSAAGVEVPIEWHRWGLSDYDNGIPFDLKIALITSAFIASGFLTEERQRQLD